MAKAISLLLDTKPDAKLKSIENRLQRIEVDLLDNDVIPRLNTIEARYTDKMDAAFADIELLKKAVTEHSKNCKNYHNNRIINISFKVQRLLNSQKLCTFLF